MDQDVSVAASHNPNKRPQLEVQLGGAVTLQCPQGKKNDMSIKYNHRYSPNVPLIYESFVGHWIWVLCVLTYTRRIIVTRLNAMS